MPEDPAVNTFDVTFSFDAEYKGKTKGILQIKVVYCGHFEFNPNVPSPLTKEAFSRTNAPAIIFPYLRETIASITTKAGLIPLILPPLSFVSEKND